MRLNLMIVFLIVGFIQVSAGGFAQRITLHQRKISLENVLREFGKQSGYNFIYDSKILENTRPVSVKLNNADLQDALSEILAGTGFSYQIKGATIVLRPEEKTLFDKVAETLDLPGNIRGKVTDQDGMPLIGAVVKKKGVSGGAATNAQGEFFLPGVNQGDVLVVSYVGFESREIIVASFAPLNIKLSQDSKDLGEVVVTGLGIKRDKRALGYAVSSISASDLADLGSPVNALTALYGQVPGLRINSTAMGPTGGINVNIRNAVSFSESSNVRPLFVIDGIPMLDWQTDINRNPGNGLNDLNLDDIESLEVLRGAKASLLYGSQGANGVILITSKTGRKRPGFGIDVNLGTQTIEPWVQQEFQNEFGTGLPIAWGDYSTARDSEGFFVRDGKQSYTPASTYYNFGPRFDGRDILWYDNEMRPYVAQPDNVRELFKNGSTSKANISLSGGGNLGGFRVAYTHEDYRGIFEGYKVKNDKIAFNGNMDITDRVRLQVVSSYSRSFSHNAPTPVNEMVANGIPRNLDTRLLRTQVLDPETAYSFWRMENRANVMSPGSHVTRVSDNYFFSQWRDTFDTKRDHFLNSLNLNIKLSKYLSLDGIGGFDWILTNVNKNEVLRSPITANGSAGMNSLSNASAVRWNARTMLRYERHLKNPDFYFSGFAGGEYQSSSDRTLTRSTNGGFIIRDWPSLENSKNPLKNSSSNLGQDRLYGIFASAQLGYKDYLFVDFQARNDWSSMLPSKNNSYFYPGTSVSWVFSEALPKPAWLSLGKLRASWADVGRPGSRYFANEIYSIGAYGNTTIYNAPSLIPPIDLKPERKREFEVGLDTRYFKDRFGLEFSFFSSNTYNQIMALSIPSSSGYSAVGINAGNISTKGYELMLKGTPVKSKSFAWELTLNGSASTPKVKKLAKGITTQNLWGGQGARIVAAEGRPFGEINLYPYATDENGNRLVTSYGFYYQDKSREKTVGNVIPDFIGGFNTNVSYKGFNLGINLDASFGSTLISMTNLFMIGNGTGKNTVFGRDEASGGLPYYINTAGERIRLDSHSAAVPNDSKYTYILHDGVLLPGMKSDGTPNDQVISASEKYAYFNQPQSDLQEDVVFKNDYIKIRDITLSYSLPRSLTSKMKFERLTLTAFANGIGFLYKTMPNVDPESFNGTNVYYENNAFPSARSYGMSIRATF
ncbi:SusC/RagA family TonB-linked outer membrane protein [Pararcticibacter amylolyticus]|nr:SusC/RagA family TonB-linked outer membrane protein [Pararcticibacter amylolyticus]